MNDIPPPPSGPAERDALQQAVGFADQAVNCVGERAAASAFYRSWQTLVHHMLNETLESEGRRLTWDRVEQLEGRLAQVRDIIADPSVDANITLRIREVLDR